MSDTPSQLGNYRILHKLGSGGMADVYEAVDDRLSRHVALKILPRDFADKDEHRKRFEKEVRATAKLNHPHIVTVYDVGMDQGYTYYTMELLPGGDLKAKIIAGLSHREIVNIVTQIADALSYAHHQGFVHRDLKPENILFDIHGKAVVTDLGIVKFMDDSTNTRTGMVMGTPYYMSPEQVRGKQIDGRSDLYSLGTLIYRMLTKEHVFEAEDSVGICMQHVNDPPPPLPGESRVFQPILDRLLAKDPNDRYQNARALIADLKKVDTNQTELLKTTQPEIQGIDTSPHDATVVSDTTQVREDTDERIRMTGRHEIIKQQQEEERRRREQEENNNGGKGSTKHYPKPPPRPKPWLAIGLGVLTVAAIAIGIVLYPQWAPKGGDTDEPKNTDAPVTLNMGSAALQVSSVPDGAEVFFEGKRIGTTPVLLEKLPAGAQEFSIQKQFYQPYTLTTDLSDNTVVKEIVNLDIGTGGLTVISFPEGANIFLNGSDTNEVTPTTLQNLTAGEYQLELRKDDALYQTTIAIEHDEILSLRPSLTKGTLIAYGDDWLSEAELLELAERYQLDGKLVGEGSDNALAALQALLAYNPGNSEAQTVLQALYGQFKTDIEDAIAGQDLKTAKASLALAQQWFPEREENDTLAQQVAALEAELEQQNIEQQFTRAAARIQQVTAAHRFDEAKQLIAQLRERLPDLNERIDALANDVTTAQQRFQSRVFPYSGELLVIGNGDKKIRFGKQEVTFELWDRCLTDGACTHNPNDEGWGRGKRPVINVSYKDIVEEFLPWLQQKTNLPFRLPTQAEWEYAARAGSSTVFSWGQRPRAGQANGAEIRGWPADGFDNTAPVGQFKANAFGLFDMEGNVWEWTDTCGRYPNEAAANGRDASMENCRNRIIKGGSWFSLPTFLEIKQQQAMSAISRTKDRGFRVVLDY